MLILVLSILSGIFIGILTGIIPTLHPNNITTLILLYSAFLLQKINVYPLIAFIIALTTTHSFTSFLASILFGVPEEDTALSVLPSHQLLMDGKGLYALYLTVVGGILSILITLSLLPIFFVILKPLYKISIESLPYLLLLSLLLLILKSENKLYTTLIVILSGALGYIILNVYFLHSFQKLTAMFAGLFGASLLVKSLIQNVSRLPPQETKIFSGKWDISSAFLGVLSSFLVILLPSLSPSQAITMVSSIKELDAESYLVSLGSLTTADAILSFLSLWLVNNPRSGSSIAVQGLLGSLDLNTFIFCLAVFLIASAVASLLTLLVGKKIISVVEKINYKKLNLSLLLFVFLFIFVTSGLYGVLILVTSTALGIICDELGVNRSMLVSSLMIPTIISFLL